MITKTKRKPKALPTLSKPVHERLADLAGDQSMWAKDVARSPRLLALAGLTAEECGPGVAHAADSLNRERTETMMERLERYGPAVLVPSGSAIRDVVKALSAYVLNGLTTLGFLRWAGNAGWDQSQTVAVLRRMGRDVSAGMVAAELDKGGRGLGVPEVDEDTESRLWELLGEIGNDQSGRQEID